MRRHTFLLLLALSASAMAPAKEPTLGTRDYIEIQQLYARYVHDLDQARGREYASAFTADGEFTRGRAAGRGNEPRTPIKGTQALIDYVGNINARHFITNVLITPTKDGAKGSCYLLLYSVRTTTPVLLETAIYEDSLVKTKAGWKFTKRTVWRDDDDITPYNRRTSPTSPSTPAPAAAPPANR